MYGKLIGNEITAKQRIEEEKKANMKFKKKGLGIFKLVLCEYQSSYEEYCEKGKRGKKVSIAKWCLFVSKCLLATYVCMQI